MDKMNLFNDKTLKHYEGELGAFDYDSEEFIIQKYGSFECLHYHGKEKSIDLPKGCINTRYMFAGCELPSGFSLGEHFDTSAVIDMRGMFEKCKLPGSFSLGANFDTGNVIDMSYMFYGCKLTEKILFGP